MVTDSNKKEQKIELLHLSSFPTICCCLFRFKSAFLETTITSKEFIYKQLFSCDPRCRINVNIEEGVVTLWNIQLFIFKPPLKWIIQHNNKTFVVRADQTNHRDTRYALPQLQNNSISLRMLKQEIIDTPKWSL